jgi:hypothetical protein
MSQKSSLPSSTHPICLMSADGGHSGGLGGAFLLFIHCLARTKAAPA